MREKNLLKKSDREKKLEGSSEEWSRSYTGRFLPGDNINEVFLGLLDLI